MSGCTSDNPRILTQFRFKEFKGWQLFKNSNFIRVSMALVLVKEGNGKSF